MIFPGQEGRERDHIFLEPEQWKVAASWVTGLEAAGICGKTRGWGGESDWSEGAAESGGLSPCLSASGSEGLRETPHL